MKINNRINGIKNSDIEIMKNLKINKIKEDKEIIDLTNCQSNLQLNENIKTNLLNSLNKEDFNKCCTSEDEIPLKKEIIKYYNKVFDVKLNLEEVLITKGIKNNINCIISGICNTNDIAIIPNPCDPLYETCCNLWGVESYKIPLKFNKAYLIDFNDLPKFIIQKSKLFLINYPNNPTGAEGNLKFFEDIVDFSQKNNIIICNDATYYEIIKKGKKPLSLLQADKDKNNIEFGSLSKVYNMNSISIGFIVGNSRVLDKIKKVMDNMNDEQFPFIEKAAISALNLGRDYVDSIRSVYDKRRNVVKSILKDHNIKYFDSSSTFYIWCKIPQGYTTDEFCLEMLSEYGILVDPGHIFGTLGNGYFRIALTIDSDIILKSLKKLEFYK